MDIDLSGQCVYARMYFLTYPHEKKKKVNHKFLKTKGTEVQNFPTKK